ncbi:MAG: hypothetical protein KUG67_02550 [Proteobacteria bacterium]|nr:hypothetical protein [Pseudomonadota bacterium]
MAWTTTDRDEVSQEGRELGAFVSRRIVDNTDDLAGIRSPAMCAAYDINVNNRHASVTPRPLVILVPMEPGSHKCTIGLYCKRDHVSAQVFLSAALGLPSGATIELQPEVEIVETGFKEVIEFEVDLAEPQRQGMESLPILVFVRSLGSTDPGHIAASISLAASGNIRKRDGTEHLIPAAANSPDSFSVFMYESTKPTAQLDGGLGATQVFYDEAFANPGGDYWFWPLIPDDERIDRMDIKVLGVADISSISVEFTRTPGIPYYGADAMPAQRSHDAAKTQVASSMPPRNTPEHAMLSTQDHLLATRPTVYAIGPTANGNNNRMLVSAVASSSVESLLLRVPIKAAQKADKLDGTAGEIRAFDVVLAVLCNGPEGSEAVGVNFRTKLSEFDIGVVGDPTFTVLKTTNLDVGVRVTSDRTDYLRNVVGFSATRPFSPAPGSRNQLQGLWPSWRWYTEHMTLVKLTIIADDPDPRADFLEVWTLPSGTVDESSTIICPAWYVTDARGSRWASKVRDPG